MFIKSRYISNTRRRCLSLQIQGTSIINTFIYTRRGWLSLPIQHTSINITFIYTRRGCLSLPIQSIQYQTKPFIFYHDHSWVLFENKLSIITQLHSKHDDNIFIEIMYISITSWSYINHHEISLQGYESISTQKSRIVRYIRGIS